MTGRGGGDKWSDRPLMKGEETGGVRGDQRREPYAARWRLPLIGVVRWFPLATSPERGFGGEPPLMPFPPYYYY